MSKKRPKRTKLANRILPAYSGGEEIFNMVSHIAGGGIGVITTVLCILLARDVYGIVSGAIFGSAMILLYTMSALYHGLSPGGMAKRVFQVLDHCTIFLLIAGTYTPITLCGLRVYSPALGWTVFGAIWAAAALGIALNAVDLKKYRTFSMICYLGMGWCIVLTARKLGDIFDARGLILMLTGGVAYTVGAILYGVGKKKKYMHSVFHIFVIVGNILHILFVLLYVI